MTKKPSQSTLLPAYLIVGEDALKRQTVLARLRKRMASLGDLSFNSDTFEGGSCSAQDVINACNTIPFVSPVRLVELREVDKLRKADTDLLVSYLASPSPTCVLALEAEKLAKNTRLYKAVQKLGASAVIDCAPPKRYEVPRMVRSMAVGQGITLTEAAANTLVDLIGTDTVHLNEELKKLAISHKGSDSVSPQEVRNMVSPIAEVKWWDFVDAVCERNIKKSFDLLSRMPSSTPYELLPRCVSRLRELMCAQSLGLRGQASLLAKELKQPDWKLKNHRRWCKNYTAQELREALILARNAEQQMKSGTNPDAAFTSWLLAVLSK